VVADAQTTFQGMAAAGIKQGARWKQKEASRLKPLDKMTPPDKADFLAKMSARFPEK
jgi:hypothetical protein